VTGRPDDAAVIVVTVRVTRHATGDFLARVDFDGEHGRIGCRATSMIGAYVGAATVAADALRAALAGSETAG
jgi:hypothetical protein